MANAKPNKLVITNSPFWYIYNTIITYFSFFENQYFLFLGLVQLSTGVLLPSSWSPTGRYSTIIPLAFCVFVEIILVYKKYFHDKSIESTYNSRIFSVLSKSCIINKRCDELNVGDILICSDDKTSIPVDCLLIEPKVCEISTVLINGEGNLRYIKGINDNDSIAIDDFKINVINYKQDDMFTCNAELIVGEDKMRKSLPSGCFIPNGSIVKKNGALLHVIGVGSSKKNASHEHTINKKTTCLEAYISDSINRVNINLLIAIIFGMWVTRILHQNVEISDDNGLVHMICDIIAGSLIIIIQSWIIFNNIIPFSVKILLVFVRCIQGIILNRCPEYQINNTNIIDEAPRINTILSDKTGTVTKGKLSIVDILQYDASNNKISSCILDPLNELTNCITNCINTNSDGSACSDEDRILKEYCVQNKITSVFDPLPLNNLKFTFERKRSSNIIKQDNLIKLFTKGSIDSMKEVCINHEELTLVQKYLDATKPSYRLLAFGHKSITEEELCEYDESEQYQNLESDLKFTGIVCFTDPLVDGAVDFISTCKQKNIKFNLCTGDRQVTSVEIARQLGLLENCENDDYIIVSDDQDFTTDKHMVFDDSIVAKYHKFSDFITCIRHGKSFVAYNMTPKSKEILAKILNEHGTLAAIGDGHNDVKMFHQSQISIAIKNVPVVSEQADLVVDKIDCMTKYLNYFAPNFTKSNKLLVNYTFYRCVATNISSLTYLLLQIYTYGFSRDFVGLFDGFTLVAFNFLWMILPIIYHHVNLDQKIDSDINLRLSHKKIVPWIVYGIFSGASLILIGNIIFGNYYYERSVLSTIIIIHLNVTYGLMTKLNWTLLCGPLLYLSYLFLIT